MAFCTTCGTQLSDEARFCVSCGKPAIAASPASSYSSAADSPAAYAPPAPVESLSYTVQGDNLQVARLHLKPGQEVYAEAGKMIYKSAAVSWETRMMGSSLGDKLWGAFKRKLMGESLFLTHFHANAQGEVGFAGNYPGRIQVFELEPNQSILVQRDAFICAQISVQLDIALVKKIGTGLLGGEGFILEKLTGPGAAFIHAGGDFVEFTLSPGESIQIQTGHLVAFDPTIDYDIQFVGGIKTAIFGGEGLFMATLTGPGKVIVQSMTLERLRRELSPLSTGGDQKNPLQAVGGLGGFFGNDD